MFVATVDCQRNLISGLLSALSANSYEGFTRVPGKYSLECVAELLRSVLTTNGENGFRGAGARMGVGINAPETTLYRGDRAQPRKLRLAELNDHDDLTTCDPGCEGPKRTLTGGRTDNIIHALNKTVAERDYHLPSDGRCRTLVYLVSKKGEGEVDNAEPYSR